MWIVSLVVLVNMLCIHIWCRSIHAYAYIHIYVYVCVCIYIHIHTHICVYIYIYVYIHTYIHTYIYIYTYMYIYMYMYTHIWNDPRRAYVTFRNWHIMDISANYTFRNAIDTYYDSTYYIGNWYSSKCKLRIVIAQNGQQHHDPRRAVTPNYSFLTLSLLRLLDSNSFGHPLWDMIIPPLNISTLLESNPLESIMLVRRLDVQ